MVALTALVLLTLIFISGYNYRPGHASQIQLSPPRVASQPHGNAGATPQREPQHLIGSDIDPANCKPTVLPFAEAQTPSERSNDIIPNIVHYVLLLNGREDFSIDFKVFISIYSAHLYFQPDTIYIHTDASPEQWEKAKKSGTEATRWMFKIPHITHHWIKPTQHTLKCLEISRIEHVADFARTELLHQYGGIYMDSDVYPLHDVRPLRESGFSNIVGIEDPGKINNGFMISRPRSALLSVFMSEQHRVFDSGWLTHSVELLSKVAYRLQAVPGEVIILGVQAFAPSSWRLDSVEALFNPHNETKASVPHESKDELPKVPSSFIDALDYWNNRDSQEGKETWEVDYSSSYVIHAFKGITDPYWPKMIDLDYVLQRRSNLARAVYPAIKHAIDTGIIDKKPKPPQ